MRTRTSLYRWARLLGDLEAAEHGLYPQRVIRRHVYRHTNRLVARLLRNTGL